MATLELLAKAIDGFNCRSKVLELASARPELLDDLLSIVSSISAQFRPQSRINPQGSSDVVREAAVAGSDGGRQIVATPSPGANSLADCGLPSLGACFCVVPGLSSAAPRASFDVKIYDGALELQSKTNTHRLPAAMVTAVYELSQPRASKYAEPGPSKILLALSTTLQVQKSQYSFLLLQPKRGDVRDCVPEDTSFPEAFAALSWGSDDLAQLFALALHTQVTRPSALDFSSYEGDASVTCNVKASAGLLFPMSKEIIFVQKPILVIPCTSVTKVDLVVSPRFMDFVVEYVGADGDPTYVCFSMLDRSQQLALENYIRSRRLGQQDLAIVACGSKSSVSDQRSAKAKNQLLGQEVVAVEDTAADDSADSDWGEEEASSGDSGQDWLEEESEVEGHQSDSIGSGSDEEFSNLPKRRRFL